MQDLYYLLCISFHFKDKHVTNICIIEKTKTIQSYLIEKKKHVDIMWLGPIVTVFFITLSTTILKKNNLRGIILRNFHVNYYYFFKNSDSEITVFT